MNLIRDVVTVRRVSMSGFPTRFFGVELKGVVRHRNDRMLSKEDHGAIIDRLGSGGILVDADASGSRESAGFRLLLLPPCFPVFAAKGGEAKNGPE